MLQKHIKHDRSLIKHNRRVFGEATTWQKPKHGWAVQCVWPLMVTEISFYYVILYYLPSYNLASLAWTANEKVKLPHTLLLCSVKMLCFIFLLCQQKLILLFSYFLLFLPKCWCTLIKGGPCEFLPSAPTNSRTAAAKSPEPLCRNGATEAGVIKASNKSQFVYQKCTNNKKADLL